MLKNGARSSTLPAQKKKSWKSTGNGSYGRNDKKQREKSI